MSSKKMATSAIVEIRPTLLETEVKTWLSSKWSGPEKSELSDMWGVCLLTEPFKVCTLSDLIPDLTYVDSLKTELLSLEFSMKNNDLYQYRQSDDLYNVNSPAINSFKRLLENTIRPWLQDVTNIPLGKKISATCSLYDDTDYLLCHDDQCEDRCIAYIFYLNQNWTSECGGALQLFNTEGSDPGVIVQTILPHFNALVFFEVSETSFHQVQEVFTMDRTRITVNGWFYGSRKVNPDLYLSNPYTFISMPLHKSPKNYLKILGSTYCDGQALMKLLNKYFERKSSVMLEDFLHKDFYQECCEALNTSVLWKREGPANCQLYEVAVEETLHPCILTLLELMKSEIMFCLLSPLTCLDLTSQSHEKTVKVTSFSYEVRKWKSGYYTLVTDDTFSQEGLLEVTLYLNDIERDCGGSTIYISRRRGKELLSVHPRSNSLCVAYRERNVAYFVKYINHNYSGAFYTVNFTCAEQS